MGRKDSSPSSQGLDYRSSYGLFHLTSSISGRKDHFYLTASPSVPFYLPTLRFHVNRTAGALIGYNLSHRSPKTSLVIIHFSLFDSIWTERNKGKKFTVYIFNAWAHPVLCYLSSHVNSLPKHSVNMSWRRGSGASAVCIIRSPIPSGVSDPEPSTDTS